MSEPWFDAYTGNMIGGLGGAVLGSTTGLWGGLAGTFAPKGRAKAVVFGLWGLLLAASAVSLVLGLYALIDSQPRHVWYGFVLIGGLTVTLLVPLGGVVRAQYRAAELRKLDAQNLS